VAAAVSGDGLSPLERVRRVEVPAEDPPWDGAHDTSTIGRPSGPTARATCTCGWLGPVRRGPDRGWQATADADDHHNDSEPDVR
jgi:hypothetical protein